MSVSLVARSWVRSRRCPLWVPALRESCQNCVRAIIQISWKLFAELKIVDPAIWPPYIRQWQFQVTVKLTYQVFRWSRLKETCMKMTSQKQHLPSFATTISALGILLYCIGFLRVELELNNQKKRLNALENNWETEPKPPSSDSNIVKIIKDASGMYTVCFSCFKQYLNIA